MSDNVMGDSDIEMNVSLRLTNIEQSSAQFDTLIQQTDEWRKSIEAVESALGDTYEVLGNLGSAASAYKDAFEGVVELSERHEAVLRRTLDNAQALALASRDLQSLFNAGSSLTNLIPGSMAAQEVGSMSPMMYGGEGSPTSGGVPYSPGGYSMPQMGGREGILRRLVAGGESILSEGAQFETWSHMGNGAVVPGKGVIGHGEGVADSTDLISAIRDLTDALTGVSTDTEPLSGTSDVPGGVPGGGRGRNRVTVMNPGVVSKGSGSAAAKTIAEGAAALTPSEERARRLMNIPYFAPFGKTAYMARYLDRTMQLEGKKYGPITQFIKNQKWLVGEDRAYSDEEYKAKKDEVLDQLREHHVESNLEARMEEEVFKSAKHRGKSLGDLAPHELDEIEAIARESLGKEALKKGFAEFKAKLPPRVRTAGGLIEKATGLLQNRALMGTVAKAAGAIAAPVAIATAAYKAASYVQGQAQEYASVTGEGSNPIGAFGNMMATKAGAFGDSFLSAGRLDSQTAMQIRMNAEEVGFRRNSGYYNDFVWGAEDANKKYKIDPQEYMALFQGTVIQTGNSVNSLNHSIDTLGKIASTTNTGFKQLRDNFQFYTSALTNAGFYGGASSAIATAASAANANNPMMANAGSSISMLNTTNGQFQAMAAMGITPEQYGHMAGSVGGGLKIAQGTEDFLKQSLAGYGLSEGASKYQVQGQMVMLGPLLDSMGITNTDGSPMTPEQKVTYVHNVLNGKGIAYQTAKQEENQYKEWAGGNPVTSKKGLGEFFRNMENKSDKRGLWGKFAGDLLTTVTLGSYHGSSAVVYKDDNINGGKLIKGTSGPGSTSSLSHDDQIKLRADLLAGKATYGIAGEDGLNGRIGPVKGGMHKLGNLTGDALNSSTSGQKVLIDLSPAAKRILVPMLGNPALLDNYQVQGSSLSGNGSNTNQNANAGSMGYTFN